MLHHWLIVIQFYLS